LWSVGAGFTVGSAGGGYNRYFQYGSGVSYHAVGSWDEQGFGSNFPTNATGYLSYFQWDQTSIVNEYIPIIDDWNGPAGDISWVAPTPQVPSGEWFINLYASGPALPVPEPNPLLLVGLGMLGLGFCPWIKTGLLTERKNPNQ
jgi:hypothetical protein